jgi:hypothetical protein
MSAIRDYIYLHGIPVSGLVKEAEQEYENLLLELSQIKIRYERLLEKSIRQRKRLAILERSRKDMRINAKPIAWCEKCQGWHEDKKP